MKALLLAPHADDETLFAAHLVSVYHADVTIAYLPKDPAEREERRREATAAIQILRDEGTYVEWLGGFEGEPFPELEDRLRAIPKRYKLVFAPLIEGDGHTEHNALGEAAMTVFGLDADVSFYSTYSRSLGRTRIGEEVELPPYLVQRKLRALAEYRSQIEHPARRPWFTSLLDLREWVSHAS